jgi:RimJ/RimL family protein N-acetyltransferase
VAVNPVLLDIPDHLETARLHLRAPRPGDGAAVNEAIRESFPELHEWMPWAKEPPTVADSEEFVRRASASFQTRTDLPLLIFHKETGLFLGGTGLHRIHWDVPCFEIGYWVRTAHSGNGYVTEAVLGLTGFVFDVLGAQRVEIHCDERNVRSAAVARRAGYTLEVVLRNHRRHHVSGALRNTLIFARLPQAP